MKKQQTKLINLKIDGIAVIVPEGTSVLWAARMSGIKIPTLCYMPKINEEGACRVCVVESRPRGNMITSCNTPVSEGMDIYTNSAKVLNARKKNVELLLSNHNKDCLSCGKNLGCKLQSLSKQFNCDDHKYAGKQLNFDIDDSHPSIIRDNSKCILCNRCISVCKHIEGTSAIAKQQRGFDTSIGCAFNKPLKDSTCIGCGQCVLVCPTGALLENNNIKKALEYLEDKNNFVVAQVAPAVRAAILEEFGYPVGTYNEGKIPAALRRLGFARVFDINVGADFTVMEESQELIDRIKENKNLPLFSSCCPAWYQYVEKHYPDYIKNLSTCKSPNEMFGALVKNFYCKKDAVKPENLKVVAIMPCVAKKHEILKHSDVDLVLTTREFASLVKMKNIDYKNLRDEKFDNPGGEYSGAALIFGATGGVTEAALRTAAVKITGKPLGQVEFKQVRKSPGIKEATLGVGDLKLNICIANGLANAYNVMQDVTSGKKSYHFIEVMACPGGCVNGGGQPFVDYSECSPPDVIEKRAAGLYKHDSQMKLRNSHDTTVIKDAYADFLKQGSDNAHKYLHHHFDKKD